MEKSVYQEEGFKNRSAYLHLLAEDFAVDYSTVWALADLLGDNEDFDGLVTSLEDMESEGLLNGY